MSLLPCTPARAIRAPRLRKRAGLDVAASIVLAPCAAALYVIGGDEDVLVVTWRDLREFATLDDGAFAAWGGLLLGSVIGVICVPFVIPVMIAREIDARTDRSP